MRAGFPAANGEDPVQQQDSLASPIRQISVLGGVNPQIAVKFSIDVGQTARERSHCAVDAKRQAHRVAECRVRVLTDDDDANRVLRLGESPKNRLRWREHGVPRALVILEET
jgi:hypothetical protein